MDSAAKDSDLLLNRLEAFRAQWISLRKKYTDLEVKLKEAVDEKEHLKVKLSSLKKRTEKAEKERNELVVVVKELRKDLTSNPFGELLTKLEKNIFTTSNTDQESNDFNSNLRQIDDSKVDSERKSHLDDLPLKKEIETNSPTSSKVEETSRNEVCEDEVIPFDSGSTEQIRSNHDRDTEPIPESSNNLVNIAPMPSDDRLSNANSATLVINKLPSQCRTSGVNNETPVNVSSSSLQSNAPIPMCGITHCSDTLSIKSGEIKLRVCDSDSDIDEASNNEKLTNNTESELVVILPRINLPSDIPYDEIKTCSVAQWVLDQAQTNMENDQKIDENSEKEISSSDITVKSKKLKRQRSPTDCKPKQKPPSVRRTPKACKSSSPIICLICDDDDHNEDDELEEFESRVLLDEHIANEHPISYPTYLRCPFNNGECICHFVSKIELRKHVMKAHKEDLSIPIDNVPSWSDSYTCHVCDISYLYDNDLVDHLKKIHRIKMVPEDVRSRCGNKTAVSRLRNSKANRNIAYRSPAPEGLKWLANHTSSSHSNPQQKSSKQELPFEDGHACRMEVD